MAFETIQFSVDDQGVARLVLNRPDRLNSFTVQMHGEVAQALDQLEADASARVLLLTGAGRGFCAGQDLADRAVAPGKGAVDLGESVELYYNPLVRRLVALPLPVVCAVNGVAAGAGANLALAGDIVIAAKSAKFIQSFANIGLIPDSGGTWILPRLIGQARALAITMTGVPVPAEQAEAWGMIWRAVADDALVEESERLVASFAKAPTLGLAATKAMIRGSWAHTLDQELDLQRDTMRRLGHSADYAEGVDAFLNKRQPTFAGR
jgi:2-(1,2-epoxy-1,2-dihydrophenyl)acetyl-CoA isomerase